MGSARVRVARSARGPRARGIGAGLLLTLLLTLLLAATPTLAQSASAGNEDSALVGGQRSGFTIEASMGPGMQSSTGDDTTKLALYGLTLGLGGFLDNEFALLFRIMGSNAFDADGDSSISSVGAAAIQYWLAEVIRFELGAGIGVLIRTGEDSDRERGWGIASGAALEVWRNAKNSLTVGIDYAPVFVDGSAVHNAGLAFGWQLL